jgi:hypothetical protein
MALTYFCIPCASLYILDSREREANQTRSKSDEMIQPSDKILPVAAVSTLGSEPVLQPQSYRALHTVPAITRQATYTVPFPPIVTTSALPEANSQLASRFMPSANVSSTSTHQEGLRPTAGAESSSSLIDSSIGETQHNMLENSRVHHPNGK